MSSFCKCKSYSHFFSKNINVHAIFNDQSFNDTLTNDIVSFEQLGPGCPKSVTTDHQIEAIHSMVMNDRRVTVQHIADTMGISVGSVHAALTYIRGMSKLSTRSVPRMLTLGRKLKRLDISRTS